MKLLAVSGAIVALCLSGCNRSGNGAVNALDHHGRYVGVGIYPTGQMWREMVAANGPKDPATAKSNDDDQVIVVVDSNTGELRECGNLSGYCVGMQPWAKALAAPQVAPIVLVKHAEQLAREAEAATKTK